MIEVDREKAAVYGITIDQIRQELFDAFGNRQVATIYTPSNDYQVILETKPEFRPTRQPVEHLREDQRRGAVSAAGSAARPGGGVTGNGIPSGQSIPLSAVTKPVTRSGRCWSTTRASSRR